MGFSAPSAVKRWWGATVLTTSLLLCAIPALAAEPRVVARVNGTPITDAMVNEVVKSLIVARGAPPSSDEIAQLSDAALASLIDLELLYGAAQQAQVRVGDDEVQAEIARSKARLGGDDAAFAAALQRSGLSEAQLAVETRRTLMVERFVERRLMKDVRVTPEAAQRFYDEHKQEFQRGSQVLSFELARPAVDQALLESERRQRQEAYLIELRKTAKIERPTPGEPVGR
jgi:SurA-like N-terminal domain